MKYKQRLKTIEAIQYDGKNFEEIAKVVGFEITEKSEPIKVSAATAKLNIVLEIACGKYKAKKGDYIVKRFNSLEIIRKQIFESLWEIDG